nr:reverse transcriptase domain-containing protein [Tanacetum cinerariifolium]
MVEKARGLEIKHEVIEVAKEVAEVAKEVVKLQNLLPTIVAQVGNYNNNQGNDENQDDNVINDNNQGNVWTINMNNCRGGCSYKEFMDCNPKYYDEDGGAIVYTRWIKKIKSVQDMSGCGENQKNGGSNEAKDNSAYYTKVGMLTDEAIRDGVLKNNTEKRGNNEDLGRDGNVRDDNKRSRTRRAFATITNHVRKKYTGTTPKCPNCNNYHQPEVPCCLCTNCNCFGHISKDCRVRPRVVNPLNARNLTFARRACFKCHGIDHYKAACPMLN